jgi:Na+/phosphate symporter
MQPVIFENLSKLLLLVHLVAGITCIATSVHLFLRASRALKRPGSFSEQMKLHATVLCVAYLTSVVFGGLISPVFRVRVRYAYLDASMPWLTGPPSSI